VRWGADAGADKRGREGIRGPKKGGRVLARKLQEEPARGRGEWEKKQKRGVQKLRSSRREGVRASWGGKEVSSAGLTKDKGKGALESRTVRSRNELSNNSGTYRMTQRGSGTSKERREKKGEEGKPREGQRNG